MSFSSVSTFGLLDWIFQVLIYVDVLCPFLDGYPLPSSYLPVKHASWGQYYELPCLTYQYGHAHDHRHRLPDYSESQTPPHRGMFLEDCRGRG
jgi:hypothetical protein